MPRYTYRCEQCKEVFEINHGMFFTQERCIKCHTEGVLTKIPVFRIKESTASKNKKVGSIVDEFIKDAKKDLKKQKKDFSKGYSDK